MIKDRLHSKLKDVGTSIFTEMSALSNQYGALNLSQGFPEFDAPEQLKENVLSAIKEGLNQYAPSTGLPILNEQIAKLVERKYQSSLNPADNITVTSGATEALFVAIQAIVKQGDEVIVFDPAYDSYEPAVNLAGGTCIHVPLSAPLYSVDWEVVGSKINSRTCLIIINSPHNPTGTLLSSEDMEILQELVIQNNLYLLSDEVYEFITFDDRQHESVHRYPELFARSFIVSSFGKTFHCTGWKLGYCCAPGELTNEFRKIHQFVTFSSFTPAQAGVAKMLNQLPEHIDQLPLFYQQKRDFLANALRESQLDILTSEGTYFMLIDYSQVSDLQDVDFCHWLTKEKGIAAIPLSPFYAKSERANYQAKVVRLCFAKSEATLAQAAEILSQL
ncbi:methionine aminotransferase [Aliikangiella sp. G2MR2-5]|uniref:methionine aminotransferase n=1 Tax=Aliikangiella sp. G2MR2-5 TaxID=2788943 RepID=UPI0018A8A4C7|nr:methionine aminotransferase [Aliikangiella sp. G2MR2-5]